MVRDYQLLMTETAPSFPSLTIAVLFGGRSGEHEVSLMSARSVLGVLDRSRYKVIEIGITHAGDWLSGDDALSAFEQGRTETLIPVTLHPDPSRPGLYALRPTDTASNWRKSLTWMFTCQCCTAPSARTAPCKGC